MSWKATLATILSLVGSSSAASYHPVATGPHAAPVVRDHRGVTATTRTHHFFIQPVTEVDFPPVEVSPFHHGRTEVELDGMLARGIELTVARGAALVQQVTIHYSDGRSQTVAVRQQLDGYNRYVDFEVEPRAISGLTIDGAGSCLSVTTF